MKCCAILLRVRRGIVARCRGCAEAAISAQANSYHLVVVRWARFCNLEANDAHVSCRTSPAKSWKTEQSASSFVDFFCASEVGMATCVLPSRFRARCFRRYSGTLLKYVDAGALVDLRLWILPSCDKSKWMKVFLMEYNSMAAVFFCFDIWKDWSCNGAR